MISITHGRTRRQPENRMPPGGGVIAGGSIINKCLKENNSNEYQFWHHTAIVAVLSFLKDDYYPRLIKHPWWTVTKINDFEQTVCEILYISCIIAVRYLENSSAVAYEATWQSDGLRVGYAERRSEICDKGSKGSRWGWSLPISP